MGMFDRVWISCPQCNKQTENQSKGGSCTLHDYDQDYVPLDVASDLEEHFTCDNCGAELKLVVSQKTVNVSARLVQYDD